MSAKIDNLTLTSRYCPSCKKWVNIVILSKPKKVGKTLCEECGTQLKKMEFHSREMYGSIALHDWFGQDQDPSELDEVIEALIQDARDSIGKDLYYEIRLAPRFSDHQTHEPIPSYVSWYHDKYTPRKTINYSPPKWDAIHGVWIHSVRRNGK